MAPSHQFDLAHVKRALRDLQSKLPEVPSLPFDLPEPLERALKSLDAIPLARPAALALAIVAATLLAFTAASKKGKSARGSIYVRGANGESIRRSSRARVSAAKYAEDSTPSKKTPTSARKAPSSAVRRSTRTPSKK